ncbi:MAG: response regulator [Desulfobulbaceae bacterium]|nr:response regulator [Desulfobulbaceae bacterium]HIJ79274.1 response regulator [Deltaproteobacteria bacterium]
MDETILLVDDEELTRERLTRAFDKKGITVFTATTLSEAIKVIKKQHPKLAVTELNLADNSGLELIKKAKEIDQEIRIIMLTGYGSIATAVSAIKLGAVDYLSKPADAEDIMNAFAKDITPIDTHHLLNDHPVPSLARVEWEHLNRVLKNCEGNISLTAKKLNVHRRTLQRKLHKYPPNK